MKILLLISTILFLSGCRKCLKSVFIPNTELCIEAVQGHAFCASTLSKNKRTIPKEEWEKIKVGRPSISPEDFAKLRIFIEEVCVEINCSKEFVSIIDSNKFGLNDG